jgi:hypothetical protein
MSANIMNFITNIHKSIFLPVPQNLPFVAIQFCLKLWGGSCPKYFCKWAGRNPEASYLLNKEMLGL